MWFGVVGRCGHTTFLNGAIFPNSKRESADRIAFERLVDRRHSGIVRLAKCGLAPSSGSDSALLSADPHIPTFEPSLEVDRARRHPPRSRSCSNVPLAGHLSLISGSGTTALKPKTVLAGSRRDLSKVPEFQAKVASSKFLNYATAPFRVWLLQFEIFPAADKG